MPLPLPVLSQPCLSAMHKPYRNVCKTPFLTTSLYFVGTPSPSKGTVANPPSSHGLSIIVSSGEAICSPILPFNRERPVSTSYASKMPAIAPKNSANRRFQNDRHLLRHNVRRIQMRQNPVDGIACQTGRIKIRFLVKTDAGSVRADTAVVFGAQQI